MNCLKMQCNRYWYCRQFWKAQILSKVHLTLSLILLPSFCAITVIFSYFTLSCWMPSSCNSKRIIMFHPLPLKVIVAHPNIILEVDSKKSVLCIFYCHFPFAILLMPRLGTRGHSTFSVWPLFFKVLRNTVISSKPNCKRMPLPNTYA